MRRVLALAATVLAGLGLIVLVRLRQAAAPEGGHASSRSARAEPTAPAARLGQGVGLSETEAGARTPARPGTDEAAASVAVATTPPVVSGLVVDELGLPVAAARISVLPAGVDDFDPGAQPLRAIANDLGAFTATGRIDPGRIRIRASDLVSGRDVAVEADAGASGLKIVLARGGAISGSLQLDPDILLADLCVTARMEETGYEAARAAWSVQGKGSGSGVGRTEAREDGAFTFRGLQPGSYGVRVSTSGSSTGLVDVPGIVVRAGGTTRDTGLDPIDLRGRVRMIQLSVVDRDRKPVSPAFAVIHGPSEHAPGRRVEFQGGRARLVSGVLSVDLEVGAPGYRTARLERVDGDREVVLQPAITVHLRLVGAMVPEPPSFLRATLVPAPKEGEARIRPPSGQRWIVTLDPEALKRDPSFLQMLALKSGLPYFDGSDFDQAGDATVKVPGPGRYEVRWYTATRTEETGSATVGELDVEPPSFVLIEEGPEERWIEVRLDLDAIRNGEFPR